MKRCNNVFCMDLACSQKVIKRLTSYIMNRTPNDPRHVNALTCLVTEPIPDPRKKIKKKKKKRVGGTDTAASTTDGGSGGYIDSHHGHGDGSALNLFWFSKIKLCKSSTIHPNSIIHPEHLMLNDFKDSIPSYVFQPQSTKSTSPTLNPASSSPMKGRVLGKCILPWK